MSIACAITKYSTGFGIKTYDVRTRQESYNYSKYNEKRSDQAIILYIKLFGYDFDVKDKAVHEIIQEQIKKYNGDIGIIAVKPFYSKIKELENFKKIYSKKYGGLVYPATNEDLEFQYYFSSNVEYSAWELIIMFHQQRIYLLQYVNTVNGKVTWKQLDDRVNGSTERIDLGYAARMFDLKTNQVHAVFRDDQEKIYSLYGSELETRNFKSINFIKKVKENDNLLIFARHLISDSEVSILVQIENPKRNAPKTYTIEDCNFIHIPKLVKEYEPRTDIMGVDFGGTRCVLAVSRNREIHVIPFDNSSPGDLWTESVVSFDQSKPLFGKAAIRRFRTKPDYVIFDTKLLYNWCHQINISKQSILPFNFNLKDGQPYLESNTLQGFRNFSIAEINKIFLEQMVKGMREYQEGFCNQNSMTKAVITVPRYFEDSDFEHSFSKRKYSNPFISSAIEAAKLANIEVIDIIEETHADLLYYLSKEEHFEKIRPGMKIAIFDIGGATGIWKIYQISKEKNKMYATCIREQNSNDDAPCSGRALDNIITEEIEKLIPENLKSDLRLRTLETAKEIKYSLSFEDRTSFALWDISSCFERIVEFTREWFEEKLNTYFQHNQRYCSFKQYLFPNQRAFRCKPEGEQIMPYFLFTDVDIVFLAGGTCRIPFVQKWIKKQFPKAQLIIDGQLEIITATGAAIHALQVLSGEVEPYVRIQNTNDSTSDGTFSRL